MDPLFSFRLKCLEPVSYCELRPKEIYTEEHEKLLGTCNTHWTLFVDGCDKDGKRIYDLVRGQDCHQCRRKTLGHHTSCGKCQIVQGQFCGDCLYTRYGENAMEAKSNPNWICPVCRGICNCSKCRTRKGWFPTGRIYRKVISLGYKSVAHYLITTQRGSANSEDSSSADSSSKLPSAKSETSCISEHDSTVAKEGLDDGETRSKAKTNKVTCCAAKNYDGYKDDCRSESVVTPDSQDDQASMDPGCVTLSEPTPRKRKYVERNPDCVASRLRSQTNKP